MLAGILNQYNSFEIFRCQLLLSEIGICQTKQGQIQTDTRGYCGENEPVATLPGGSES